MKNDFEEWVDEWVKKLNIVKVILIILLAVMLIIIIFTRLNEQENRLNEMEKKIETILEDNKEIWKNIDAMSEDYTTLWVQLYGEDSWYEKPEDKEKVQNQINSMGE